MIILHVCYMFFYMLHVFRLRWTMPSARGPRRIMAHFKKRREYMSQVIHYTKRQCKLLQHTNIDINKYGDWGLPSVHQLRTHLEIVTSISLSSRYRFAEQMYQKQSSSVCCFFTSWNKTLPSSPTSAAGDLKPTNQQRDNEARPPTGKDHRHIFALTPSLHGIRMLTSDRATMNTLHPDSCNSQ